jgi:hypothetical protein
MYPEPMLPPCGIKWLLIYINSNYYPPASFCLFCLLNDTLL